MLNSVLKWINFKIGWFTLFRMMFFKKNRQIIVDNATAQEKVLEFTILNIIGARLPGSAERLSEYYIHNIYDDPDLAEFNLAECKNIIKKDEVFDYFINKHLRVLRDNDTFEQLREIENHMHELAA